MREKPTAKYNSLEQEIRYFKTQIYLIEMYFYGPDYKYKLEKDLGEEEISMMVDALKADIKDNNSEWDIRHTLKMYNGSPALIAALISDPHIPQHYKDMIPEIREELAAEDDEIIFY